MSLGVDLVPRKVCSLDCVYCEVGKTSHLTIDSQDELAKLKMAIDKIRPDRVQINTLDRPGSVEGLRSATRQELQRAGQLFGPQNAEIIATPETRRHIPSFQGNIASLPSLPGTIAPNLPDHRCIGRSSGFPHASGCSLSSALSDSAIAILSSGASVSFPSI
jgi:hypothetical protein